MDRQKYIEMCQKASFKTDYAGAWWNVRWNDEELVIWNGDKYVPVDYRFGFRNGNATHVAIIHSLKSNAEYHTPLKQIMENK